uniref:RabBD domain-containing protein n=1 Tax=Sus scrofa TaxID=9823 RepID=A0A8D1II35_PIG
MDTSQVLNPLTHNGNSHVSLSCTTQIRVFLLLRLIFMLLPRKLLLCSRSLLPTPASSPPPEVLLSLGDPVAGRWWRRHVEAGVRTPCPRHTHSVRGVGGRFAGGAAAGWVCMGRPRGLCCSLSRLQTGWSVHTYQTEKQRKSQCLSPAEVEAILQVIQRAERLDVLEQQRIGRLVERLETMRHGVMGNGLSQCLLCGEVLGFLGSSSVFCKDCRKVWKRSGAWFYKGIPKYILPLKTPGQASHPHFQPLPVEPTEPEPRSTETSRVYTWARGRVVSSDSDSDSDLSSSSLENRLPAPGTRDPKGDKPWGESGGSMESPKMGPSRPPSHLSGSQSSLASEAGTGAADPQVGTPPWPDPKGPGKRHTWASPRC